MPDPKEPRPVAETEPRDTHPAAPRSALDKAGDEVASWFGNPGALSRRQRDQAAGDHTGEGPAFKGDEDARIVEEINRRLTDDSQFDASKVQATCAAGVVTLAGQVATSAARRRAEDLAAAVAGVTQVRNTLVIA